MKISHDQSAFLEKLDTQQNEVIRALDDLNARIETVIDQWSKTPPGETIPTET